MGLPSQILFSLTYFLGKFISKSFNSIQFTTSSLSFIVTGKLWSTKKREHPRYLPVPLSPQGEGRSLHPFTSDLGDNIRAARGLFACFNIMLTRFYMRQLLASMEDLKVSRPPASNPGKLTRRAITRRVTGPKRDSREE